MFKNAVNFARRQAINLKRSKVGMGLGMLAFAGSSMAADGELDTTTIVAGFVAAAAAAVVVSIAWTSATYSIKGSKLLRKG